MGTKLDHDRLERKERGEKAAKDQERELKPTDLFKLILREDTGGLYAWVDQGRGVKKILRVECDCGMPLKNVAGVQECEGCSTVYDLRFSKEGVHVLEVP